MKKIFLTVTLSALATFGFSGCGSDSGGTTNALRPTSNQNSAAINASNINIGNNSTGSTTNTTGASDNDFMTKAAQGGIAEVELGRLATEKAQNAEVKKFAQMMIQDHSNANTELKSLASKKSVTLPTETDAEHKAVMDKLKALSGAEFDKAYVQAMVDDHKKTVALFETESTGGADADAKAFALKTLPNLKTHLEMIQGIQAKMK